MKRTLARWMAEKQAMDRVEQEAVNQLGSTEAETRREVAGADFPRRAHEKGIIPAVSSYLKVEDDLQHVADALEIISRIISDNDTRIVDVMSAGAIQELGNHLLRVAGDDHTFGAAPAVPPITTIGCDPKEGEQISLPNRIAVHILDILRAAADLQNGRELIVGSQAAKALLKTTCGPSNSLRRKGLYVLVHLAEDIFQRDEIKKLISGELGLGGFEMLKFAVFRSPGVNEEESKWLYELGRHLELLPGLKMPGRDWYDPAEFPFVKQLEEAYPIILEEFKNLELDNLVAWPEKYLCKKGWDVFPFWAFKNKMEKNCSLCPKTAALIESIPGMATAMFSCLQPRTHIKPHIGYQQYSERILRCHLGIIVPKGCFLKVNWEDRTWEEGKCLVFDDTFRHEAWNPDPDQVRIVLMIDFFYGGKSAADGRNPDFVRQMEVEGAGQSDDAIISGDLLAAIQAFGATQNITKGKDDRFS